MKKLVLYAFLKIFKILPYRMQIKIRGFKRYWIPSKKAVLYKNNENKITSVLNMLHDDFSKDTLIAYMEYMAKGNSKKLLNLSRPIEKQYFEEQIFKFTDNETFVDMGVFDASTSLQFATLVKYKYDKILMFEPDSKAYKVSQENIEKYQLNNVLIFNEGCYDCDKTMYFSNDGTEGSHITEKPDDFSINVVSLDSKIKTLKEIENITYIKMDIEGAEYKALIGCSETIKKYKPKLAICIYHKSEDIYEIPLLIKKILPEYKLYIRHYNIHQHAIEVATESTDWLGLDIICYATL